MKDIIFHLRQELESCASPQVKESAKRFFKEEISVLGVKSADVLRISKEQYNLVKNHSKKELFIICEKLLQIGFFEASIIACNWSYIINKNYTEEDFIRFKYWIDTYINNWASCDTFCNHNMGIFIEKYPQYLSELKKFCSSPNRWMRRAAAVSLIVPARKGKYLNDIFEIASLMLTDKDDMVQKGYGWMLKVASKHHQKEVFDFVMKNKNAMPRTALRYAIEKMPESLRQKAMEK